MEMAKYHESLENSSKVVSEVDNNSTMATQIDEDSENDNTGIGRTYECSYCKRGFNNAQALGGHMNIHRKDKAKAKQQQQQNYYSSSTISYKREEVYSSSYTTRPCNLTPQMDIYGPNNSFYQSYYPFANNYTISSSPQPSIYGTNDFSSGRTRIFDMYEEQLGTDLSLRMSSYSSSSSTVNNLFYQGNHHHHQENKLIEDKYGAIDLELRLGYDP